MENGKDRKTVMEQIAKLLTLADPSKNDSQGQIMAALAKARELMDKYQIAEGELKTADVIRDQEKEMVNEWQNNPMHQDQGRPLTQMPTWAKFLIVGLAKYCDVEVILRRGGMGGYNVLGRKDDVLLFKQMFSFVSDQMHKLKNQALRSASTMRLTGVDGIGSAEGWQRPSPIQFTRQYLSGMGIALQKRLMLAADDRKNYSQQMMALVVSKMGKVTEFYHQQFPVQHKSATRTQVSGAFYKGKSDAAQVRFHPAAGSHTSALMRQ